MCVCACVRVCVCACVHVCMCAYVHVYVGMWACGHVCMGIGGVCWRGVEVSPHIPVACTCRQESGATPLYISCDKGYLELVTLLISSGGDVNLGRVRGTGVSQ